MAHQVRYLILACALLWGAPWSSAQTPKAGQGAWRWSVFSLRPIEGLGFAGATGAMQAVTFNPTTRSPRYVYTGTMPLRFVDTTSGKVVAEATIPPEIREPLLLFSELEAPSPRGLRYQIAILDDSAAKLAPGQLAILNLSGLKLTGALDKAALALGPGLNPPVPFTRLARLTLFTTAHGTRVQSYTEVLKAGKAARLLLILFPPSRKGGLEVQVRALAEEPPAPAPPILVPTMRK